MRVNPPIHGLRRPRWSASVPKMGANKATAKPESAMALPQRAVPISASVLSAVVKYAAKMKVTMTVG